MAGEREKKGKKRLIKKEKRNMTMVKGKKGIIIKDEEYDSDHHDADDCN